MTGWMTGNKTTNLEITCFRDAHTTRVLPDATADHAALYQLSVKSKSSIATYASHSRTRQQVAV